MGNEERMGRLKWDCYLQCYKWDLQVMIKVLEGGQQVMIKVREGELQEMTRDVRYFI